MEEKLKVVVAVAQAGRPGAVAVVAVKQARELARRFEVTLASDSFPADLPDGVRTSLLRPWNFRFLRRFAHVPYEMSLCRELRTELLRRSRANDVDFVLCHSHAFVAHAVLPLVKKGRPKVGLVTHGDVRFRPAGTYDARLTRYYQAATEPAYRGADLVVALSPVMAERAISGGASRERVDLIPNGFDPQDIGLSTAASALTTNRAARLVPPPEAALRVLFVGRLSVEKGITVLLESARRLAAESLDVVVTVAGDGGLRADVEAATAEPAMRQKMRFLGPQDRSRLAGLYAEADILVVPSLDEPLPTVALEALACGVPVIGSEVGGIPFLVDSGRNGILVRPGEAEALADAIRLLALDRELLSRIREGAASSSADFRRRFSWEANGEVLATAIERCCRRHPPRRSAAATGASKSNPNSLGEADRGPE